MPETDIHVTRYSFYEQPNRTNLRFVESAPESLHVHGFECGCTTTVDHRPVGIPSQVRQSVKVVAKTDAYRIQLELDPGHSRGINIYWKWPENVPRDHFMRHQKEGHAHFWMNNGLQIEILGKNLTLHPGNDTPVLLTRMFRGEEADTSRLLHGHMRSKVVDPSQMKGQIWIYKSLWDKEAIATLPTGHEWMAWNDLFENMKIALEWYAQNNHIDRAPSEVRQFLLSTPIPGAEMAMAIALELIDKIEDSALSSAYDQVMRETR